MDYEKAYFDALKCLSDAVDILEKMRNEAAKPYLKSFKVRNVNDPHERIVYDEHSSLKDSLKLNDKYQKWIKHE